MYEIEFQICELKAISKIRQNRRNTATTTKNQQKKKCSTCITNVSKKKMMHPCDIRSGKNSNKYDVIESFFNIFCIMQRWMIYIYIWDGCINSNKISISLDHVIQCNIPSRNVLLCWNKYTVFHYAKNNYGKYMISIKLKWK